MTIELLVKDPERIRTIHEVDEILSTIEQYEKETGKPAGVLKMQNRQLGAMYYVASREEANKEIAAPKICEWGIKFYPYSFFKDLKQKMLSD